jgi:hypothetical protein
MICPACGEEECQDRKTVLDWRKRGDPSTLYRECPNGHAWHMPLLIKPATRPGRVIVRRSLDRLR